MAYTPSMTVSAANAALREAGLFAEDLEHCIEVRKPSGVGVDRIAKRYSAPGMEKHVSKMAVKRLITRLTK